MSSIWGTFNSVRTAAANVVMKGLNDLDTALAEGEGDGLDYSKVTSEVRRISLRIVLKSWKQTAFIFEPCRFLCCANKVVLTLVGALYNLMWYSTPQEVLYEQLLNDAQMEIVKLSRSSQVLYAEKENKIWELKARLIELGETVEEEEKPAATAASSELVCA